jgi:hypothetical protein
MIKKYLGIVGFLLSMVGIITAVICEWKGIDVNPLGEISFICWITTMTISSEINKEQPNNWWVYIVSIGGFAAISALIFLYR